MHEHSVIAALAELERLEQDRVGDERRRAAEQKLRAIERDVERRFGERLERECSALQARLTAAHAAREALLEQRIDELRAELAAANAARDTLREALTVLATPQPDARSRGARMPLRAVVVAAIALAALAVAYGVRVLATPAAAPRMAAPAVDPSRHAIEPSPHAVAPVVASQAVQSAPPAGASPIATPPRRPSVRHPVSARPRPATSDPVDPLGPIDGCGDDPTCGL